MGRREKLEALLAEDPDDPFLNYALALQCVSDGNPQEGGERLGKLIHRDPDYVAAYLQLGQILEGLGQTDQSRDVFHRGIEAARRAGDDHAESEMRGFLSQIGQ